MVNNFVSGLILLFERPIHVGDIIHMGDLSGEVRIVRDPGTEPKAPAQVASPGAPEGAGSAEKPARGRRAHL